MSLAARILLLIALAMAPVMVAQVYTQVELQFAREADDRSDAIRYARLVSSDALRVVEGMKGIMTAVRETPFVRAFDEAQCRDYLANLARRYPQIFNITLIDESGQPICANTPSAPNATARDRLYFQEALRTEDFVIGDYIVGRTIPQPQLPVALPFRDDAGRRLVLSIGINVDWLQRHFHELDLPPEAALWLTDRKGIVVVAPSASSIGFPLPADLQASRTTQEAAFRYQDTNGNPHMVGVVPAVVPPIGLSVVVDLQQQPLSLLAAAEVRRDLIVLAVAILAAIVLATVGTWRLVSRPLQRLTAAARQWTAGAYDVRVNLPDRSSEVGRLGAAFDQMADAIQTNQRALQQANETLEQRVLARTAELSAANRQLEAEMAERQAAEAALRQSQKMEAIGRLTGGIAHDFNNLLTAIGGSIDFLHNEAPAGSERAQRYYTLGREAVQRAGRMTHRLLAFARQQPLEMQTVDLNRLVAGMSDLLMRTLGEDVAIETVLAGGLWPTCSDPAQIENALLNLAINARDAMPDGGRLTIETANAALDDSYAAANADVEPGQYVMLAVSDTGTGMTQDVIARAFDPFFTTKEPGRGTGLGLSMVYGFAKQSGGHLKIYSEPGRGTTVKLYLPRLLGGMAEAPGAQVARRDISAPRAYTVLVAEDDAAVRELATAFLESLGYTVLAAPDGPRALQLLRSHPEVSVLFTDVVMTGGMSGRDLASAALVERPDLRVLFTTGYTPNAIIHGGILDPGVHLLTKPFTAEALGARLRALLEQPATVK